MNLRGVVTLFIFEALRFARDNQRSITSLHSKIVGVQFDPESTQAEFNIFLLSFDTHERESTTGMYRIDWLGGNVFDKGWAFDRVFCDERIDTAMEQLPSYSRYLQYTVLHNVGADFGQLDVAQCLSLILPSTKDSSTKFVQSEFKQAAIDAIKYLN